MVWAEIMKAKGEFETAKMMYERALEINENDMYLKKELTKLNAITDPKIEEEVERVIIKLAEQRARLSSTSRHCDIV